MNDDLFHNLLELGLCFAGIVGVAWIWFKIHGSRRRIDEHHSEQPNRILVKEYLGLYSKSSNGIYHLYGTMRHFFLRIPTPGAQKTNAIIGYVVRGKSSIMLTDPLCRPDLMGECISGFVKSNKSEKRETLLLAIDQHTADEAKKAGFKLLKIGQEPIFDLATYDPEKLPSKLRSSARQVEKKGVVLEEVSIEEIFQPKTSQPLNELLAKWFMTRGSDAFKLLTEVAPAKVAEEKKFFIARSSDSVEGLLVCSRIFGRNGYFLHDLIRAPFSVNGVTDALVIFALKTLKQQGYSMASLGVSPLAGLPRKKIETDFPKVTRLLNWVFDHLRSSYRFRELYHFKKKFLPTSEENIYLAVPKSGLRIGSVLAILGLFANLNPIKHARFILRKWRLGYDIPRPLGWAVNPAKIVLPPMASFDFETIITRLRFTLGMIFLNIYTFVYTTDISGKIDDNVLKQHGFSFDNFVDQSWYILVSSNFVHFNYTHLVVNMIGLALFCGALEVMGGSVLASVAYLFGMQANLPTGLVLLPLLKVLSPTLLRETTADLDVGASLGVMAAFGALLYLLKPKIRHFLFVFSCIAFTAYAILTKEMIGFDHAVAVMGGMIIARVYFKYQPSQAYFDVVEARYFDRRAKRTDRREAEYKMVGGG